jgi:hypothetical protein
MTVTKTGVEVELVFSGMYLEIKLAEFPNGLSMYLVGRDGRE